MAYSGVTLPLTGAGDATASPAVDVVGGLAYQAMKLVDGLEGSTDPVRALGTTPGATDHGVVTRPIGSTAHAQAVVGAVGITSGSSQVGITSGSSAVELTSAGSTRLAGRVTVDNPTTAVSLSSQHTVTAELSSVSSTKLVGQVTVGNPTTAVTVSSGVVLGAGSSTNTIGNVTVSNLSTGGGGSTTVDANLTSAGSTKVVGLVSQGSPAGTSADAWWVRSVTTGSAGGSTTVDANLSSAGSTKIVGLVDGVPFTSAGIARTTFASSVSFALFPANANRRAIMIANNSTGTVLLVSLNSTAAVTSGGPYNFQVPALGTIVMGGQVGNMPNFTGLAMAKLNSTAVAGTAFVTEYT